MEDWLSYSLSDLVLFSPTTYFRLYELHNAALWPLQLIMVAVAFALLLLTRQKAPGSGRKIGLILGLLWMVVAWWFMYKHYGQINTAAPWISIIFSVEVLALLGGAIIASTSLDRIAWQSVSEAWPGLMLFLYALLVHPMVGLLSGRPWNGMELFGIAPDPTAIGTLGILLMGRGMGLRLLALIPLLWCLFSGLTYLAMGLPYGLLTPAVAVFAWLAAILLHREDQSRNSA